MIQRAVGLAIGLLILAMTGVKADDQGLVPSAGRVTLTWPKFNELWAQLEDQKHQLQELQNPEVRPPVPFALSRAAYQGVVGKTRVAMQARFEITVFEPKNWVKVPFLPAGVAIQNALLDGQPVGVRQEDGPEVVLKGAGRHLLSVQFSLKAPDADQAPQLHFDLIPTPMTALALTLPQPQADVHVEPSQGLDLQSTKNQTLLTANLPPTSSIDVRWQKAVVEENEGPSKLYLENDQLLTVSESAVHAHAILNYSVLHHAVRQFFVMVPSGWTIFSVQGEGLQDWKRLDHAAGTTLLVTESDARKGPVQIVVDLERTLAEHENAIDLLPLKPIDVEQETGAIGLEVKGSVDMSVADHQGLSPIDPQELPPVLWQSATQPILNAFRYTSSYTLSLLVTRPPEASVLTTTIDQADAVTLLTDRGQVITQVTYQVRNHLKPSLLLALPKGAQLWSAFVAGQAVKPTLMDHNTVRIPLAKSQMDDRGMSGFPVDVLYYQPTAPWSLFGMRHVLFPVPDAPITRASWALSIPEHYRLWHLSGDMDEEVLSPLSPVMALRDKETKDFVQKKIERTRDQLSSALGGRNEPVSAMALAVDDAKSVATPMPIESGVFPVAFQMPSAGQWSHFSQVMVVGTSPQMTYGYVHRRLAQVFWGLIVLAAGMGILYRRQNVQRVAKIAIGFHRRWKPQALDR